VIACNPPMRANETEASRLVTAALRRVGWLANWLMIVTQPVLERKRLGFLTEIARGACAHLVPGGRLILVISPLEEAELPRLASGLVRRESRPVLTIPGLSVVTFVFNGSQTRNR
jgi:16S rRNA G1207 methylase RsmC